MNCKSSIVRSIALAAVAALVSCSDRYNAAAFNPALEVDPFIGTDYTGNTYPGAQTPHGMVQLSPDNGLPGWDRIAGYYYPDSTIAGFSHTHLSGTGAGDLYDISFMPAVKPFRIAEPPLGLHSRFDHASEEAHAGYYKVNLSDYNIEVELTATAHGGVQRYTWPADSGSVFLNLSKATNWDHTLEGKIEVIDSVTIAGWRFSDGWARNQKVWFATRFSKPYKSMNITRTGSAEDAEFVFETAPGEQLTVVTALSGVDTEGALRNLRTELPHDDFDVYRRDAEDLWNDKLSRIEIVETDSAKRKVFYTALYHSLLAPTLYSDVDGRYLGADGEIRKAEEGHSVYHVFSLWDTYRAAHPLYTIIEPSEAGDMARSLVDFAAQSGQLPVWTMWGRETDMMIGYHSAPVIVDAIAKDLIDIDPSKALELCVATARNGTYRGLDHYMKSGYVAADIEDEWAMSKTLEYAYDDYAISRLAQLAGDSITVKEFEQRAANYRNQFNAATGFMQPRLSDGKFLEPFSPDDYSRPICESNAWHYLWSVQHDIEGLKALIGGDTAMEERLDRFFTDSIDTSKLPIFSTGMIGQYAHGNEPSHHVAYLYNYVGRPEKTQKYVRKILEEQYTALPDGLCGNEDCGQMSAWYVFSSLGFYPVDPVSGYYDLGYPMFDKAVIRVPGNPNFEIQATISESPQLNGNPVNGYKISHSDIVSGGVLKIPRK